VVEVAPFGAYHYNTARFGKDITRLVAPPYDVIDARQEKALKDDRLNIVHVTLGNEGDEYRTVSKRLRRWINDHVLVRDEGKSFYVYEQTYESADGTPRVRSGIVGLVKLEYFTSGKVLPHEMTIPKHRQDRLALRNAVRGDTEQIFMLYRDPSGEIEEMLRSVRKREEMLRFVDSDGVHHRVFKIHEKEHIATITQTLSSQKLLIADGHHRYEVALEYRDRIREVSRGPSGSDPWDYVAATMVSFDNPGLSIYPTHRLVKGIEKGTLSGLRTALQQEFELKDVSNADAVAAELERAPRGSIAVWVPSAELTVVATPREPPADRLEGLSVYVLQEKVLKGMLGFTQEMLDKKTNVDYVKGTEAALGVMRTGEYQACFMVKPPTPEDVMSVADSGRKMPQKSTYFFPKIWSGTLLYLH